MSGRRGSKKGKGLGDAPPSKAPKRTADKVFGYKALCHGLPKPRTYKEAIERTELKIKHMDVGLFRPFLLTFFSQVMVVSESERIDVFLTRSCVQVTDISCEVVYEATLASPVLFRSYRYVNREVESFVVF